MLFMNSSVLKDRTSKNLIWHLLIYLFSAIMAESYICPSLISFLKIPKAKCYTKVQNWLFTPILPHGWQGPRYFCHHPPPALRCPCKKQSRNLNQGPLKQKDMECGLYKPWFTVAPNPLFPGKLAQKPSSLWIPHFCDLPFEVPGVLHLNCSQRLKRLPRYVYSVFQ